MVHKKWCLPLVIHPSYSLQGFKEIRGLRSLGLSKELEAWRQRVCWLRQQQGGPSRGSALSANSSSSSTEGSSSSSSRLPDLSDEALVLTAGVWLKPYLSGVRSKADLAKLDWQVCYWVVWLTSLARLRAWA